MRDDRSPQLIGWIHKFNSWKCGTRMGQIFGLWNISSFLINYQLRELVYHEDIFFIQTLHLMLNINFDASNLMLLRKSGKQNDSSFCSVVENKINFQLKHSVYDTTRKTEKLNGVQYLDAQTN